MKDSSPPDPLEGQSLQDLLSQLAVQSHELMRREFKLGRLQAEEKFSIFIRGLVPLLFGGLFLYTGFLLLLFAAAASLTALMEPRFSASLVGVFLMILGGVALWRASIRLQRLTQKKPKNSQQTHETT